MTAALLRWLPDLWRVALLFRILQYPAPHTGFNVLLLSPLFVAGTALGVLRRRWVLLAMSLASLALLAALYQMNVLVPYEVWLKRGMPDRPF
jgi:hypothetical protein